MNCKDFDKDIELTFQHYGPIGVDAQLYSVTDRATDTPPGNWISVTVVVTPVVAHPVPHTDTWYYGGLLTHTTHPGAPLGVRPIDRGRLVGACTAVEAIRKIPGGDSFPVEQASCTLVWPLVPGVPEPTYTFTATQDGVGLEAVVGAYSGKVHTHPVMPGVGA